MTHEFRLDAGSLNADREDELRTTLFKPMGAQGVYARTDLYEGVADRLARFITRHRAGEAEVLRFPPVMSRRDLERHGYLKSFPNLIACACALHGSEAQIREAAGRPNGGWVEGLQATDLVLSPAACYPIYPIVADRGPVPAAGLLFDVAADCFRREPALELDRLQSFRMREYVCFGTPDQVAAFLERWQARVRAIAEQLALPNHIEPASDPFFGRTGQMMAATQLQMALKFELLVPMRSREKPTACVSFNNHKDHFSELWDIQGHDGLPVHTGCVAFGMDRLTLALFWMHGCDTRRWPDSVRQTLGL